MKKISIIILSLLFIQTLVLSQDQGSEKETPPPGGTPKDFTLPSQENFSLPNGIEAVMVEYGAIPKAQVNLVVKTGNIHENENQVWLSDMVGDLMQEGTTSRSANEIADALAGMGGELSINVGAHTTTLSTNVLYEFVPDAIDILADVLVNPAFPESEMERLKNDRKRNLSVSLTRPRPQAQQAFYKMIYPDHPYGRIFPTEEMLDSYTVDDVKNFYNENFGGKRTTVYIVGKFDASNARMTIESSLSTWKEGPDPSYPVADPVTTNEVSIIDRPDAPQSTIMMGLPVVDPSNPDFNALDLTNSLLGGSFGSRITRNIREDKGYTYSPFSNISTNYMSAVWYEMADVTADVTGPSLQEITKEIYKLQEEAPTEKELEGIQNYEAGIFVLQNSTPGGIIGQLVFMDLHELDESYLTNRVKNIYAVTPEMVSDMTKKYIKPEEMTLVLVGDKKLLDQQIKDYEDELKKY